MALFVTQNVIIPSNISKHFLCSPEEGMEIRNKMANFSLRYSSGAFVLQNFGSNRYADSCCQ